MLSFTGLWGPAYLKQRFALVIDGAAAVCSVMIVCWAVASPLAGHFSDAIGRRKPIYLGGAMRRGDRMGGDVLYRRCRSRSSPIVAAIDQLRLRRGGRRVRVRQGIGAGAASSARSPARSTSATCSARRCCSRRSGGCSIGAGAVRSRPASRVYPVDAFHTAFGLIVAWAVLSCFLIALHRETPAAARPPEASRRTGCSVALTYAAMASHPLGPRPAPDDLPRPEQLERDPRQPDVSAGRSSQALPQIHRPRGDRRAQRSS